jgi:hypothetical protein
MEKKLTIAIILTAILVLLIFFNFLQSTRKEQFLGTQPMVEKNVTKEILYDFCKNRPVDEKIFCESALDKCFNASVDIYSVIACSAISLGKENMINLGVEMCKFFREDSKFICNALAYSQQDIKLGENECEKAGGSQSLVCKAEIWKHVNTTKAKEFCGLIENENVRKNCLSQIR